MIAAGDIRCVDEVRNELARRDDAIHDWAESQRDLFVPLAADIQLAAREVLAAHQRLARARNGVVVTEETLSGNLSRPRIPDVCEAMGIWWVNLVRFVQEQGWTF